MATKISLKPSFDDEENAHADWLCALGARLRAERAPSTPAARLRYLVDVETKTLAHKYAVSTARFASTPVVVGTPSEDAVQSAKASWSAAVGAHAHAENVHALEAHVALLLAQRDAALFHFNAVTAGRRTGLIREREQAEAHRQYTESRKVVPMRFKHRPVSVQHPATSPNVVAAIRKAQAPVRPLATGGIYRGFISPESLRPLPPTRPTSLRRVS
jgi:hypothetical protein